VVADGLEWAEESASPEVLLQMSLDRAGQGLIVCGQGDPAADCPGVPSVLERHDNLFPA
jgi:hypothetical protein